MMQKKELYAVLDKLYYLPDFNTTAICKQSLINLQDYSKIYYCTAKLPFYKNKKTHSEIYITQEIDQILRFKLWQMYKMELFFNGIANQDWYYNTIYYLDRQTFIKIYQTKEHKIQRTPDVYFQPLQMSYSKSQKIFNLNKKSDFNDHLKEKANLLQQEFSELSLNNKLMQHKTVEKKNLINVEIGNLKKKILFLINEQNISFQEVINKLVEKTDIFIISNGIEVIDPQFSITLNQLKVYFSDQLNVLKQKTIDENLSNLNLGQYEYMKQFNYQKLYIQLTNQKFYQDLQNDDMLQKNDEYIIKDQDTLYKVVMEPNKYLRYNRIANLIKGMTDLGSTDQYDYDIIEAAQLLCNKIRTTTDFTKVFFEGIKNLRPDDLLNSDTFKYCKVKDLAIETFNEEKIMNSIDISILKAVLDYQIQLAQKELEKMVTNMDEAIENRVIITHKAHLNDVIQCYFEVLQNKAQLAKYIVPWYAYVDEWTLKQSIYQLYCVKFQKLSNNAEQTLDNNKIQFFAGYAEKMCQKSPFKLIEIIKTMDQVPNEEPKSTYKRVLNMMQITYQQTNSNDQWEKIYQNQNISYKAQLLLYLNCPNADLIQKLKQFTQENIKKSFVKQFIAVILSLCILMENKNFGYQTIHILMNMLNIFKNIQYDTNLELLTADIYHQMQNIFTSNSGIQEIQNQLLQLKNWMAQKFILPDSQYFSEPVFISKEASNIQLCLSKAYLYYQRVQMNKKQYIEFCVSNIPLPQNLSVLFIQGHDDQFLNEMDYLKQKFSDSDKKILNNIEIVQLNYNYYNTVQDASQFQLMISNKLK